MGAAPGTLSNTFEGQTFTHLSQLMQRDSLTNSIMHTPS
jgi:hypothetical protein